jgi:hypothetical protein
MTLRLRVGLLHIYNVVVRDGLYKYFVRLRGAPKLINGFGRVENRSEPGFFKEGEFIDWMLCFFSRR